MNKTLIVLILTVIVLSWNFIFTSDKKIDLTDQAKVLQGVSLALKYKATIMTHWREKGVLADATIWAQQYNGVTVDTSKSLVERIEVGVDAPGVISLYFKNKQNINVVEDIDGQTITLTPTVQDKKINWKCTGNLSQELLPKRCQYIETKG